MNVNEGEGQYYIDSDGFPGREKDDVRTSSFSSLARVRFQRDRTSTNVNDVGINLCLIFLNNIKYVAYSIIWVLQTPKLPWD